MLCHCLMPDACPHAESPTHLPLRSRLLAALRLWNQPGKNSWRRPGTKVSWHCLPVPLVLVSPCTEGGLQASRVTGGLTARMALSVCCAGHEAVASLFCPTRSTPLRASGRCAHGFAEDVHGGQASPPVGLASGTAPQVAVGSTAKALSPGPVCWGLSGTSCSPFPSLPGWRGRGPQARKLRSRGRPVPAAG